MCVPVCAHLLVDVVVNPLLTVLPLCGHGGHLLLQPLVALQQGPERVLAVRVVRGCAVPEYKAEEHLLGWNFHHASLHCAKPHDIHMRNQKVKQKLQVSVKNRALASTVSYLSCATSAGKLLCKMGSENTRFSKRCLFAAPTSPETSGGARSPEEPRETLSGLVDRLVMSPSNKSSLHLVTTKRKVPLIT